MRFSWYAAHSFASCRCDPLDPRLKYQLCLRVVGAVEGGYCGEGASCKQASKQASKDYGRASKQASKQANKRSEVKPFTESGLQHGQ